MDITINIDSDKFKDVIQNELNAFSKDEIHEIIRQGCCLFSFLFPLRKVIEGKDAFLQRAHFFHGSQNTVKGSYILPQSALKWFFIFSKKIYKRSVFL